MRLGQYYTYSILFRKSDRKFYFIKSLNQMLNSPSPSLLIMVAHPPSVLCLKRACIFENSLFKFFILCNIRILKFMPCRFNWLLPSFNNLLNRQSGYLGFGRRCRPCWVCLKMFHIYSWLCQSFSYPPWYCTFIPIRVPKSI